MGYVLSFASAVCLFLSSIWADFIEYYIGIDPLRSQMLAVSVFLCIAARIIDARPYILVNYSRNFTLCAGIVFACLLILALALVRGYSLKASTMMYAPCVAFLLALVDQQHIQRLAFLTLIISMGLQIVEVASGDFIYALVQEEGYVLDEHFFGGASGVFRSKGLFAGPTSAAAYAILCVLLLPRSLVIVEGAVAVAAMSGSRSGILFAGVTMIVLTILGNRHERRVALTSTALIATGIGILALTGAIDSLVMERLVMIFDTEESTNIARFYYWYAAFSAFNADFSNVQQFLGWPRSSYVLFENGAESMYLQVLLDCGIFGLIIYLVAFVAVAARIRRNSRIVAVYIGFAVIAAITPLFNQAGLCILFWFVVFGTLMFPEQSGLITVEREFL